MKDKKIGFIGQGFIGKNMADDFAERGYSVVRYALGEEYVGNREAIADCSVVFIAVPTPTTPSGFVVDALTSALSLVGKGKVAVIKSTVVPGTTRQLQAQFPDFTIIHSLEFLREKFASEDTRHPERTVLGLVEKSKELEEVAKELLTILPKAENELVCLAEEAELIKYGGNCFLAMKVVYMNLLYDMAKQSGVDYEVVAEGVGLDKRIGMSHTKVLDSSGQGTVAGRGAGGHCFPKDLAAFRMAYEAVVGDTEGVDFLRALEEKNLSLLRESGKDIELLKSIYEG